ncbi:MAG: site-specific integrase [Clostridia bacterium]|nr:site-specific integrase [Clostridia bacterium]MBR6185464.1 site-specific integrase [Clostridia bacterium]
MSKRPNGDGSITRYKEGWRGRYIDPVDHKQRAVYGASQEECKKKLDAIKAAIQGGVYVRIDKILTGDWLDFWFQNYYCVGSKQSSQATTRQGINAYLKPTIGKIPLQKLTTDHAQSVVRVMQKRGLAPSTIHRHIKTLKQALSQAVKVKKIHSNPVNAVILPSMEKPEIKYLTAEEQQKVLQHIPATTHGRAIRFLLGTGMRVSELCGLKWKDVQADGLHVARINMTIKDWQADGYINVETLPKTAAGKRVIPLPNSVKAILEDQRRAQMEQRLKAGSAWAGEDPGKANCYIFANSLGKPADRHNIARAFRDLCDKAGIPRRGIHTTRHTFATNWVQNNPDIASLSRILGHADTAFTYRTYCHADQQSMERGMEQMASFI